MDLPGAEPERVAEQLCNTFGFLPHEMIYISAKSGLGCEAVLPAVAREISAPVVQAAEPPRALLFDCWYDEYRGVICLFKCVDGTFKKGDTIVSAASGQKYSIGELGVMHPECVETSHLGPGQVGYVVTGMKSTREARVGDTFSDPLQPVEAFPGFKPALPMAYAGLYPVDSSEFPQLDKAIQRLLLNDASVQIQREHSGSLGLGFRCGFLGLLHMDVFHQRLEQDFGAELITTSPTVPNLIKLKNGEEIIVSSAAAFPDLTTVDEMFEPVVKATVVTPAEYLGGVIGLLQEPPNPNPNCNPNSDPNLKTEAAP